MVNNERQKREEKLTISVETLKCLMRYPNSLLLYLVYCEAERYYPGRLIPWGYIKGFAWGDKHPFNKEKLVDRARGKLLMNGLLRQWIITNTSDKYYQTESNPWLRENIETMSFTRFCDDEELQQYMEEQPPLIVPEEEPKSRLP